MNNNLLFFVLLFILIFIFTRYYTENNENIDYYIPKITWSYWHDISLIPESIYDIIKLKDTNLGGYQHILLSDKNIYDYIDKEEFPKYYNQLLKQHKADWIRLYLLSKYGGTWIDSSIIITKLNDIDEIYNTCYKNKYELMAFYLDSKTINNDKYSFIENWFLIAPINSPIIYKWKEEFEHAINIGFINYNTEINKLVDTSHIDNPYYLTMHCAIIKLIQLNEIDKNKIYLKNAEDDMFNIHIKCNWDRVCVMNSLEKNEHLNLKYVKLRNVDRNNKLILIINYISDGIKIGLSAISEFFT
jgi:hypothetical protein